MAKKVKCRDNIGVLSGKPLALTVGKLYDVLKEVDGTYFVTNDRGDVSNYKKERFEVVEDWTGRSVICKNDANSDKNLTAGKTYKVIRESANGSEVLLEGFTYGTWRKDRFELVPLGMNETWVPIEAIEPAVPATPAAPDFCHKRYYGTICCCGICGSTGLPKKSRANRNPFGYSIREKGEMLS